MNYTLRTELFRLEEWLKQANAPDLARHWSIPQEYFFYSTFLAAILIAAISRIYGKESEV